MENLETKIKKRPFSLSMPRTLALILHYFLCYGFLYRMLASKITLMIDPTATMILPVLQWIIYILTMFITLLLAWPACKYAYVRFRDHWNHDISLIAVLVFVLLVVNMSLSLLVSTFTQTNGSTNQQIIKEASTTIPLITIMATCVVAPFVEECVFRCGAFAFLRRKCGFLSAAIMSSLLFSSIHFFDSLISGNMIDFSYIIVYAGLGMVLAYGYEKSDHVIVPFTVHFMNNAISMLVMFL